MAEKKKELEWEKLPPERQEEILRELEEAESKYGDNEASLWELDASISENVDKLRELDEGLESEAAEIRRMPRGRERAERARALAAAIRERSAARLDQARTYREYLAAGRELETQRKRLGELRKKTRLAP